MYGKVYDYILKQNAILYKTKNGGYVDIEELNKKKIIEVLIK